MKRTEILDFNSFAYMQEGENVNMIYTRPLPFFCPNVSNASLVVKHQLQKLSYAPNTLKLDSKENVFIPAENTDNTEEEKPTVPEAGEGEEGVANSGVTTRAETTEAGTSIVTYVINQDNRLVFLVDKNTVLNDCMAREFIVGFIVLYETPKVAYTTTGGNTATYNMIIRRAKDNMIVSAYQQSTLPSLTQLIPNFDNTLDVNATGGYIYEIFRDLTACKK